MQFCHQRTTFLTLNLQFAYFVWSKMSVKGIIMFLGMNNTRLERKILIILDSENGFLPTYLPLCNSATVLAIRFVRIHNFRYKYRSLKMTSSTFFSNFVCHYALRISVANRISITVFNPSVNIVLVLLILTKVTSNVQNFSTIFLKCIETQQNQQFYKNSNYIMGSKVWLLKRCNVVFVF